MIKRLFTAAAVWTTLGLASGLFYREFTRQRDFSGFTQLSVAHTHALALGTTILLVVLAVTKVFKLDADRRLRWFLLFWNVGLGLTFTMMLMKGSLQVLGAAFAATIPPRTSGLFVQISKWLGRPASLLRMSLNGGPTHGISRCMSLRTCWG